MNRKDVQVVANLALGALATVVLLTAFRGQEAWAYALGALGWLILLRLAAGAGAQVAAVIPLFPAAVPAFFVVACWGMSVLPLVLASAMLFKRAAPSMSAWIPQLFLNEEARLSALVGCGIFTVMAVVGWLKTGSSPLDLFAFFVWIEPMSWVRMTM